MKEGYKKTELGWIPEEWEVNSLSYIAEINPKKQILDNEKEVSFISMENISNAGRVINKDTRNYGDVSKGYTAFRDEDVLLAKITPCFENGKKAVVRNLKNGYGFGSTEFHVLRSRDERSIPEFLYYYVSTNKFKQQAELNMTGSAGQKRVPTTFLNDNRLVVPPLKEQQKIAEILSTIDSQIDDTDKLIEKTKELKKGLMQRLLTKGIGHTEFKITEVGEIPVEWEIITVGKLVTLLKSGLSRSLKEENVGVPCIRSNNIKEDKLVLNDLKYWYNMDDKGAKIEDYILDEGDIIVNFINSISQIGKGCIFNKNDFRTIYTTNLLRIKVDNSKIINTFFYYYIQTERYRKEITLITKPAVNQASFTTVEYKSIKFPVPNLEEQRLISNILVSVDTQIEEYENKKSKLEELKKGLMQKLLTGKIRVV